MNLYFPMKVQPWSAVQVSGVKLKAPDEIVGFIPVYANQQVCYREYPDDVVQSVRLGENGVIPEWLRKHTDKSSDVHGSL